ncbi:lipoprotein [Burkholderia arboris]|uniref:Lipoprotein n=1 Tax=Burkholderia arboris TaxID=488730 RepID=A0A9Q9UQS2_9BURK|nr:spore coat U domain-containing protein [Burkholderia arboris]VWB63488.1 lipoprotein [Burkholderia arboris]
MRSLLGFIRRAAFVALIATIAPIPAYADCTTANPSPAAFGSVTSLNLSSQQQSTSSPSAGLSCGGALFAFLVSGNAINGTITSANGGKLRGAAGDAIAYTMFADKNYSQPLNFGQLYNWADTQFVSFLGLGGGSSVALPLFFRTALGSNVAAGTYTDTLTIAWNWHVCSGAGFGSFCLGWNDGQNTATFPVTLTVTNDCTITAPDVNFGSAPTVASFAQVNGSLSLTCTKGMTYTVGLSPGSHAAANGRRQMTSGTNVLQYDIYAANGGTIWGQATNRVGSGGAADGTAVQTFPYVARIYTDQSTPPVGSYTDSVIVDVRY